jgi:hypothetical protein
MRAKECKMNLPTKLGIVLLLTAGLIACGGQRDASNAAGQASATAVVASSALHPVNNHEADAAPLAPRPETEMETLSSPVGAAATSVQFSGVTFAYPTDLIREVVAEQLPAAGAGETAVAPASAIPQPVLFTLIPHAQGESTPPTLLVQAVREKNGLYYSALPQEERLQLEALARRLQQPAPGENESLISFVNGLGLRSLAIEDNQPVYHFQGITHDGRYRATFTVALTTVAAAEQTAPALTQLDDMLKTLFIDGSAEALNVTNCVDDAEFVANVTIPDGTEIAPGATFVKTWRMRNTGTCTWTNNYSWTFKGGDVLTVLDTTGIDLVSPGEEIDISVTLIAPESPGAYAGQWQLSGANQFEGFGSEVYYLIVVPEV